MYKDGFVEPLLDPQPAKKNTSVHCAVSAHRWTPKHNGPNQSVVESNEGDLRPTICRSPIRPLRPQRIDVGMAQIQQFRLLRPVGSGSS